MRVPAIILGVVLIIVGGIMAAGLFKYKDTEKVVDFGKFEIEATTEKTAPLNWGYILMGGGVLVLVAGAMVRKSS